MGERMVAWVCMPGPEGFTGENEYLLQACPIVVDKPMPAIEWRSSEDWGDCTILQGHTVARWGRTQRVIRGSATSRALDLNRPYAILEPTLSTVPLNVRVNPRSRQALESMWEAFEAELAPLRMQFGLGQRCFELLSSIQNCFTSTAQYHLDHARTPQATLQPMSAEVFVNPVAQPASISCGQWHRRAASMKPAASFERMALPKLMGIYCQRTTRRLFKGRLRAAHIGLRMNAVIRLADHTDQVLAILVKLQAGTHQFADLAQQLGMPDDQLGNLLLGLYLSGIVELDPGAGIATVFAPAAKRASLLPRVQTLSMKRPNTSKKG